MEISLGQRLRELPGPLLLTGHTGFKGTWMTLLLGYLSVPVVGYSLRAEKDSLYDRASRIGAIPETFSDIRNYEALEQFIDVHKPSAIIHMAAQPLVLKSYETPRETFDVNVMGTVNVLDIAFKKSNIKEIIVVTTDKVYKNNNSGRAFIETDPLEGKDPYSASKVGTESVVAAWQQIAKVSGGPKVASVRAGNVIGGGDFAKDRIIPDLIRGVINGRPVEIRNPKSTRPWQHVLDPLVGYLKAGEKLLDGQVFENMNFGPDSSDISVQEIVKIGKQIIPGISSAPYLQKSSEWELEAQKLKLSSNRGQALLNWEPKWNSHLSIEKTFNWWKRYLVDNEDAEQNCMSDIRDFLS
jgi:CDP-glucose 4,6-dehydratase